MGDIRAPQGTVIVAYTGEADGLNVPQGQILAAYNLPAESIDATFGTVSVTYKRQVAVDVTQGGILAVVRGRISNPRLKAWTFDLDGHEFYVLRLGGDKTLVYDVTTEQWSWWSSGDLAFWRANIGANWIQNGSVSQDYGSNVVVGDDTTGILWVLNPEQGYDDPTQAPARESGTPRPFPRVATGQVLTRGRITIPCYQVYLTADTGQPGYVGASVSLSYSDDQGQTFASAGAIESNVGNYYQEFAWRSLGLVRAPGRLFRVEDDGAFAKIDELSIADVNPTS